MRGMVCGGVNACVGDGGGRTLCFFFFAAAIATADIVSSKGRWCRRVGRRDGWRVREMTLVESVKKGIQLFFSAEGVDKVCVSGSGVVGGA